MPAKKLNLIGLRFGKLIVLQEGSGLREKDSQLRTTWICKCDCGNETEVRGVSLRNGNARSCGCSQQNALQFFGDEASLRDLFREYRNGAKRRNFVFNLNLDEFRILTSRDCIYCGGKPSKKSRARKGTKIPYIYNGIDRIHNQDGYILANCAPCCFLCNRTKWKLEAYDFLAHIDKIYEHHHKPGSPDLKGLRCWPVGGL
jgi:hypothetical protein